MIKSAFLISTFLLSFNVFSSDSVGVIFDRYQINKETAQSEFLELKVVKEKVLDTRDGNISLKLFLENSNDIIVVNKTQNEISFEKLDHKFELVKKTYDGKIQGTLFDSIMETIDNANLAQSLADSFKEEFYSTKGLRVDAHYSFEVETFLENGDISDFGNITSAEVVVGRARVEKILMRDVEKNSLMLKNKIPNEIERIFESPTGSVLVSSLFNLARKHPVKRRIQPHNGIDFRAHSGSKVFPALDGEVITIGRARAKGKFIVIRHTNGFETTYDHLRKFQKGLRIGDFVDTKDQIGEVGRTGYATGAHLHFGMLKDGFYVNPIYYLKDYKLDSDTEAELEEYEN